MAKQKPILQHRPMTGVLSRFGISILESHHSDQFFMEWSKSQNLVIIYVMDGSGHLQTKTCKYPMKKERVIIVPSKTSYRIVDNPAKPVSLYLLAIHNPEIESWCLQSGITECLVTTDHIICSVVKRIFKELLFEDMMERPAWELLMASLAVEMLGVLLRNRSEKTKPENISCDRKTMSRARVAVYIRDISEHFYRHQTLLQAATSTGLGVRRFSILFREMTGMSWLAFLKTKRIEYAKRLLSETDRSIISICFECGFDDVSTFYRCFNRFEKMSPNKWRETKCKAGVAL